MAPAPLIGFVKDQFLTETEGVDGGPSIRRVRASQSRGGRKVLTFANHLEDLIIFTNEAQCSQCIHTTMNIIKPSR